MTKRQIFDEMFCPLRQAMTAEQYEKLLSQVDGMTDYEFNQLMAEAVYMASHQEPVTPKRYSEDLKAMREANGVTAENSALNSLPVLFLSDGENAELWEDLCRSAPSDHICLKGKDDEALCRLWKESAGDMEGIPSDLFFAGNIPLLDCSITVDERDTDPVNGRVCNFRVAVFEDYKERIVKAGDAAATVGAIVIDEKGHKTLIPVRVCKGMDAMLTGGIGWHGISAAQREAMKRGITQQDIVSAAWGMFSTWYGIQIALLHPTVRDVFRHPQTERAYNPESKKRKRITRYVKRHVVRAAEVESAMYGSFTRHALAWYAIGHWRRLADGRKVFVKPYWKGALRELKRNLDDREREIVIGGETV